MEAQRDGRCVHDLVKWTGEILSAESMENLWVTEEIGNTYVMHRDNSEVFYGTIDRRDSGHERCTFWNDFPQYISWLISKALSHSVKGVQGFTFHQIRVIG